MKQKKFFNIATIFSLFVVAFLVYGIIYAANSGNGTVTVNVPANFNGSASVQVSVTGQDVNNNTLTAPITLNLTCSPVNAVCGSSSGQTFSSAPFTNLCADGSSPAVTVTATGWSWTCAGGACGGASANCSAVKAGAAPAAGVCGTAATTYNASASGFSGSLCSNGSTVNSSDQPINPTFPSPGSSTTWYCSGTNGGSRSSACTATVTVHKYGCSSSACVLDDVNGSYTTSNCNNACGSITCGGNGQACCPVNSCSGGLACQVGICIPSCNLSNSHLECVSNSCQAVQNTANSCTNTCLSSSDCQPTTNGSCGTASKIYASSATSFGSDSFCNTGVSINFNPNNNFPAVGSSITWTCQGSGPGHIDASCSASRATSSTNDPSGYGGASATCQTVSMWWFRNGAATYNIYRNTTNNVATAVKIVSAAPYTDPNTGGYVDNVSAGTYYYWVENSGGMNKIALNTNSTGGLTVAACPGPTNGTCGSSNGQTLSSAPSTNLCNTGTASAVTGSGPWDWSCVGTGVGHTDASCQANKSGTTNDPDLVDGNSGACERTSTWWLRNGATAYNLYRNTSNNAGSATKILSNVAYIDPVFGGYIDTVAAGTYYYWVQNVGSPNLMASAQNTRVPPGVAVAACPGRINGTCGSSNGQTLSSAPSTNLCNTGTASAVSGSGPWEWSCVGTGVGHTDASCEAKAAAATCDFTIAPMSSNFGSSGGVGSIGVFASAQICPWTAVSNNSWLHIISGSSGTGNGVSVYSVDSYSGSTVRTGTITIAGKIFTVTQDPPTACNFSINPTNKHFPSAGGSGNINAFSDPSCSWTAVSNDSWVHITYGKAGMGDGLTMYSVDANPSTSQRVGTITIAGQTFTVTQDPPVGGGPTSCSGMQGFLQRDYWNGIAGTAVSNLTSNAAYPNSPTGSTQPNSFEAPSNIGDNYGQRMYGLVKAPSTGSYTFYIASDDDSQLWISTDATPANKLASPIASVSGGWNFSREWTKYPSQTSAPITLTAGQTYYIEALMKEASGGDVLAVGWKVPGSSTIDVVPGSCLSPYASASPPGGPPAGSVHVYNSATDAVVGRTACQRVTVVWTDNSTDETGFKIFKDGSLLTTRSASSPASQTGSVMSYTFDPGDTSNHNYAVASTNAIGDSAQVNATENPTAAIVCGGNLGSSDKNIVALNGNNLYSGLPYGSQCDSVTDALPANTSFKIGDKLKFAINLCNTGQGAASNISVTDTMINLIKPSTLSDFNAYWGATKLTYDGDQAPGYTAQANHYFTYNTTAIPNQTIKFVLNGSVAAGTSPALTFEAQTAVPASFTGAIARLQNGFNVSYNNGSIQTTLPSARYTPLIPFLVGSQVPTIREIP
jgi:hypothetical protein